MSQTSGCSVLTSSPTNLSSQTRLDLTYSLWPVPESECHFVHRLALLHRDIVRAGYSGFSVCGVTDPVPRAVRSRHDRDCLRVEIGVKTDSANIKPLDAALNTACSAFADAPLTWMKFEHRRLRKGWPPTRVLAASRRDVPRSSHHHGHLFRSSRCVLPQGFCRAVVIVINGGSRPVGRPPSPQHQHCTPGLLACQLLRIARRIRARARRPALTSRTGHNNGQIEKTHRWMLHRGQAQVQDRRVRRF